MLECSAQHNDMDGHVLSLSVFVQQDCLHIEVYSVILALHSSKQQAISKNDTIKVAAWQCSSTGRSVSVLSSVRTRHHFHRGTMVGTLKKGRMHLHITQQRHLLDLGIVTAAHIYLVLHLPCSILV
jgi:hypothetical protein